MRVHHVAFRTRALPRLEAFYASAFGMRVVRRDGERSVWLALGVVDGGVLMLEAAGDGEPAIPAGAMEFLAFAVDAADLPSWRARFDGAGVPIEAATASTLYVRDPDGRRVGVSAYAF